MLFFSGDSASNLPPGSAPRFWLFVPAGHSRKPGCKMPSSPVEPSPNGEPAPQRVESLFDRALDLAPEARNAFLDPECGGDEKLRQYMEQLLAVSAAAASNPGWGEPAILKVARASAEAADPNLDSYRLLQRIGVGAMGVVYRAVRSDDTFSKAQEPPDAAPDMGRTTCSAGFGGVTCACSSEVWGLWLAVLAGPGISPLRPSFLTVMRRRSLRFPPANRAPSRSTPSSRPEAPPHPASRV